MGKGKSTNTENPSEGHSAAPLSTLKDPSAFGPPPKHVAVHGPQAANESARTGGETGSAREPPPVPSSRPQPQPRTYSQDTQNYPAPHPQSPSTSLRQGLPSESASSAAGPTPGGGTAGGPPKLPPRLPPRQNRQAQEEPSPPPSYDDATSEEASEQTGYINQAAAGRLGRAGVSVPELGIGNDAQSPPPERQPAAPASSGQMNELQSRFAKMGRNGSSESNTAAPAEGTTWAQKQAALRTADSFKRDPSSVSFSDARSAASTANNFRQRHGEQVKAGLNTANGLGQKWGVSGEQGQTDRAGSEQETASTDADEVAVAAASKKKPPPPPKKGALAGSNSRGSQQSSAAEEAPPPIPLASKPRAS